MRPPFEVQVLSPSAAADEIGLEIDLPHGAQAGDHDVLDHSPIRNPGSVRRCRPLDDALGARARPLFGSPGGDQGAWGIGRSRAPRYRALALRARKSGRWLRQAGYYAGLVSARGWFRFTQHPTPLIREVSCRISGAPPAPSTWRSAPRGRRWSPGNRSASPAGARS